MPGEDAAMGAPSRAFGRWEAMLGRLRRRLRTIRLLLHARPAVVVAAAAGNVASGMLATAFVFATSVVLGRIGRVVETGSLGVVAVPLAAALAAYMAQQLLEPTHAMLADAITRDCDRHVRERLLDASLEPPGIAHLEDPALGAFLANAAGYIEYGAYSPGAACAGLVAILTRYTRGIACTILVCAVAGVVPAVAFAVAAALLRHHERDAFARVADVWAEQGERRREATYFRRVGIDVAAVKDIRLFGLVDWLSTRYRDASLRAAAPLTTERRRAYGARFVPVYAAAFALAAFGAVAVAYDAASGSLGLRDLVIALQAGNAILLIGAFFPESDFQSEYGMQALDALEAYERGVRPAPAPTEIRRALPPRAPTDKIRFEDVGFAYAASGRPILKHLDLTIQAHRCTAIVGLNGAGKTTIIKLLGRLYEPTHGRITVDGIPLADLDVERWRERLAVLFQDFVRYELPARDNIALGAGAARLDDDAILRAAERAGALDVVESLPARLDTPLSRRYRGGSDLSGGEWQRVALARLYAAVDAGAGIVVLDEPTASLDARAEAQFFDEFRGATLGLTTVLISHRFATVRHADHVVVVDGGAVAEEGTHDALVAADGLYASLFRFQQAQMRAAERAQDEDGV